MRSVEQPPAALTTRCHGTSSGLECIAHPTAAGEMRLPSSTEICPYVITRPRGIARTSTYTASNTLFARPCTSPCTRADLGPLLPERVVLVIASTPGLRLQQGP